MGSPERRAALAASATCLTLAILDFELRIWDDARRFVLLGLGVVIALVAGALFSKNRGAVVLLGATVGIFTTAVELGIAKHVWPSWAIAAGLAWPVSLGLVVGSARVVAKPGSVLHAIQASVPWLVPAALSAWAASSAVVLCVWHRPTTLEDKLEHFALHPWAIVLFALACILACAQVARSAIAVRMRTGGRDLGLGVEERHEDAPMNAYRAAPIAVSAAPRGMRALVVYGSVAACAILLCSFAIAPALAYQPMCVCEGYASYAERNRQVKEFVGRGDECAADRCVLYSPAERITATAPAPEGPMGTFDLAGAPPAHQPVLVLEDGNAWAGSTDGLPAVTVYEDGLILEPAPSADGAEVLAGTVPEPKQLAATIAKQIEKLPPRFNLTNATDQPEVTIFVRTDGRWRAVTAVGFRPRAQPGEYTVDPPLEFTAAYETIAGLRLAGEHSFPREDFIVELHDGNGSDGAAWPPDVPAPPPDLARDHRYIGNLRVFDLHGDAGAKLRLLARRNAVLMTPSGEHVSVHVRGTIPAGEYIEKLGYCKTWSRMPFHVCDIQLPGRP